jgi:hypothetical protein
MSVYTRCRYADVQGDCKEMSAKMSLPKVQRKGESDREEKERWGGCESGKEE